MPAALEHVVQASPRMKVSLVLEPANTLGMSPVVLAPGRFVIGSASDCDLVIDRPGVHPLHCTITCEAQRVVVKADDSRTWINDYPCKSSLLKLGDQLAIGPVVFRVRSLTPEDVVPESMALPASVRETTCQPEMESAPGVILRTDTPQSLVSDFPSPKLDSLDVAHRADDTAQRLLELIESEQAMQARILAFQAERDELVAEKLRLEELNQQLQAEAQSLLIREQQLQRIQAELAEKQAQVAAKEEQASGLLVREEEIRTQRAELEAARAALTEQQAQLASEHEQFALQNQDLQHRETELANSRNELQSRFAELDEQLSKHAAEVESLKSRAEELELNRQELVRSQEEFQVLQQETQARVVKLDAESERLRELEQQQEDRAQTLAAQVAVLAEQTQALAQQQAELETLSSELEQQAQSLQVQVAHSEQVRNELEAVQFASQELQAELSQEQRKLDGEETRLSRLTLDLADRANRLDEDQTGWKAQREEQERSWAERMAALAEREHALEQADAALKARQYELQQQTMQFELRRAEDDLSRQTTILSQQPDVPEVIEEQEYLSTQTSELVAANASLAEQLLTAERETVATERQALRLARQAFELADKDLVRDVEVLTAQRQELDQLRQELASKQQRSHQLEEELQTWEATLANREEALESRLNECSRSVELLHESELSLCEFREDLEDWGKELSTTQSKLEEQQADLAWREHVCEQQENQVSASWAGVTEAAWALHTDAVQNELWSDELAAAQWQQALANEEQVTSTEARSRDARRSSEWAALNRAAEELEQQRQVFEEQREAFANEQFGQWEALRSNLAEEALQLDQDMAAIREAQTLLAEKWQLAPQPDMEKPVTEKTTTTETSADLLRDIAVQKEHLRVEWENLQRATVELEQQRQLFEEQREAFASEQFAQWEAQRSNLAEEAWQLDQDTLAVRQAQTLLAEKLQVSPEPVPNTEPTSNPNAEDAAAHHELEMEWARLNEERESLTQEWAELESRKQVFDELQQTDAQQQFAEWEAVRHNLAEEAWQLEQDIIAVREAQSLLAEQLQQAKQGAEDTLDSATKAIEEQDLDWEEAKQRHTQSNYPYFTPLNVDAELSVLEEMLEKDPSVIAKTDESQDSLGTLQGVEDPENRSVLIQAVYAEITRNPEVTVEDLAARLADEDWETSVSEPTSLPSDKNDSPLGGLSSEFTDEITESSPEDDSWRDQLRSLLESSPDGVPVTTIPASQPHQLTFTPAEELEEDPTLSLRAKLAEMFNISLDSTQNDSEPEANLETVVPASSIEETFEDQFQEEYQPEPVESAVIENTTIHEAPTVAATVTSEASQHSSKEDDFDENFSIEAYMARLLKRNNKEPETTPVKSAPAPVATSSVTDPVDLPANSENSYVYSADSLESPKPVERQRPDVEKIRAGLDSMREVANRSARQAIATSQWKRMRMQILFQCLLSAGCFVTSGVMFFGQAFQLQIPSMYAWMSLGLGAIMGIEVFRKYVVTHHGGWSLGKRSELGTVPESANLEKDSEANAVSIPETTEDQQEATAVSSDVENLFRE